MVMLYYAVLKLLLLLMLFMCDRRNGAHKARENVYAYLEYSPIIILLGTLRSVALPRILRPYWETVAFNNNVAPKHYYSTVHNLMQRLSTIA